MGHHKNQQLHTPFFFCSSRSHASRSVCCSIFGCVVKRNSKSNFKPNSTKKSKFIDDCWERCSGFYGKRRKPQINFKCRIIPNYGNIPFSTDKHLTADRRLKWISVRNTFTVCIRRRSSFERMKKKTKSEPLLALKKAK